MKEMKYGVSGTGDVGHVIASKLIDLGHEVMMGARSASSEKAQKWAEEHGSHAYYGTFEDAAKFGERVFNCTQGIHAIEALELAGKDHLNGKILIDTSNPFHYEDGHISLDPKYSGNTSLGEEIQKFLPETRVVKTLNYIGSSMMDFNYDDNDSDYTPFTAFYCGNDSDAKRETAILLYDFGWRDLLDIGDISMSRYTEILGAFWVPLYKKFNSMKWGFALSRNFEKTPEKIALSRGYLGAKPTGKKWHGHEIYIPIPNPAHKQPEGIDMKQYILDGDGTNNICTDLQGDMTKALNDEN